MSIRIEPYSAEYRDAFYRLNEEWITTYFQMEPLDHQALEDPQKYILDRGGHIFVATVDTEPLGVCALIRRDDLDCYELGKMAVSPKAQGEGLGWKLGRAVVEKARELGARRILLETNTVLVPAVRLYQKLGFRELEGAESLYDRCNIIMELPLTSEPPSEPKDEGRVRS